MKNILEKVFVRSIIFVLALICLSCTQKITSPEQKAQCVICFDDGCFTVFRDAYPIMKEYGFGGECFIVCSWINYPTGSGPDPGEEPHDGGMSLLNLAELYANDWKIQNHTKSHFKLPLLTNEQKRAEINGCYQFLKEHGFDCDVFASPFDLIDSASIEIALEYHNIREKGFIVTNGGTESYITPSMVMAEIGGMIKSKDRLILVYHNFCNEEGCESGIRTHIDSFRVVMDYLNKKRDEIEVVMFDNN